MKAQLKENIEHRLSEYHEDLKTAAQDICEHGCVNGVSGFIYYSETGAFYKENREDINALLASMAYECGENMDAMVQHFRGVDNTREEIYETMNGGEQDVSVANVLVWVAVEHWANLYIDA